MFLLCDLKYALRSLLRTPTFTVVAVLTLALGIGANTAIFSVIRAVFIKDLPFEGAQELVYVHVDQSRAFPDRGYLALSAPHYRVVRERQQAFTDVAVFSYPRRMAMRGQGETEILRGPGVTGSFFPVLGVKPHLGRTLLPGDDGTKAMVLTYALWQKRFAGDPAVVGRPLNLDTRDYLVVGVLPPDFRWQYDPDFFTADGPTAQDMQSQRWGVYIQNTVGRLKPGLGLAQAQADLARVQGGLVQELPRLAEVPLQVTPFRTFLYGDQGPRGLLLGLTGGLVLLIACANLANLLVGRAAQRQREAALRQALGGTRMDGLRPFLAEGLLLAFGGGGAGLLLSLGLNRLLLPFVPEELHAAAGLDAHLLLFAFSTALGTGLLAALVPVVLASRENLSADLRQSGQATQGRRQAWLRSGLVTSQVALSLALLVTFGVLLQSLRKLDQAPLGFQPDQALVLSVSPDSRIHKEGEGRAAYLRRILAAVSEGPGVARVALTRRYPPDYEGKSAYLLPGQPDRRLTAYVIDQGPGCVEALGMTLLKGRDFESADCKDQPDRILVSRSLAARCWPGQDPIGQILVREQQGKPRTLTVMGLVEDVRFDGPRADQNLDAIFYPTDGGWLRTSHLVVRGQVEPGALIPGLRARLKGLDPDLSAAAIRPLRARLDQTLEMDRNQVRLLGVLAALALVLAAGGIYGVMATSVTQRTREIGIRKALGGQNAQVVLEIVRRGLVLIGFGLGLGVVLILGSEQWLKAFVYGVSASDPLILALAALVLGLVALMAALIPASRAARIQPAEALRSE